MATQKHALTVVEPTGVAWAWLAGFIDGEGSIGLHRERDKRKGPNFVNYRPSVQITQVDGLVMCHVRQLIGGGIITRSHHRKNAHARNLHHFNLRNRHEIGSLLEKIIPHLHVELEQAVWLLQYCRNRDMTPGRGRYAPITDGDLFIYDQLKRLNRRGMEI